MEGNMAEKLKQRGAAPTLLVLVEKQQQQLPPAAAPFLHTDDDDDIQRVNLWTFFNALNVTFSVAVGAAYYYTATLIVGRYPSLSWLLPSGPKLTDAESNLASTLWIAMLWCSTPQAATGALALLLPRRRWRLRRAAAYAALALTVASRCLYAGTVMVYARADPEGLFFKIGGSTVIFMSAVVDLHAFLMLLRGEWAN